MDDDLRALERRAAADPTLQPLLRKARERAGLGRSLELRSAEQVELVDSLHAAHRARDRWRTRRLGEAETRVRALRSCVTGAFADLPHLAELTLDWRLRERTTGPWTVALRAHVPAWTRSGNALDPDDARALEAELLRHSLVLPRRNHLFGARRVRRAPGGLLAVEELARRDRRAVEALSPEVAASEVEVPLRLVEDLDLDRTAGRFRPAPLEHGEALRPGEGTREAAGRLADAADADRAEDDAELLAEGAAAWDDFVTVVFAEHLDLDLFAVRGWTSGYNDNWHDEHDQALHVTRESFEWLPEVWGHPLPTEVAAALGAREDAPLAPALASLRRGIDRNFDESVFGRFLRVRHGHDWLLVVRRDGDHVVERLLLRPGPPAP